MQICEYVGGYYTYYVREHMYTNRHRRKKSAHVKESFQQLPPELSCHMHGNVSGDNSHPPHVLRGHRVGEVCV